jgi:hypothetical protein
MSQQINQAVWDDLVCPPTTDERHANATRLWSAYGLDGLDATQNLATFLLHAAAASRRAPDKLVPAPPREAMLNHLGDRDYHYELAQSSWNHLTGRLLTAQMGVDDPRLSLEAGSFVHFGPDALYWFAYWAIVALNDMEARLSEDEYADRVNAVVVNEFGIE